MSVLLIDNYDSFTFNLYQQFAELGAEVLVHRNDAITLAQIEALAPSRIILSPGPGRPESKRDFGVCAKILAEREQQQPILGVCLGHQGIVHHFGGKVVHAPEVRHGKLSRIAHNGDGLFKGVEESTEIMRYHSLVADRSSLPECLEVTATSMDDSMVMAVAHRELPIFGVQFHPESIGSREGSTIARNFLDVT